MVAIYTFSLVTQGAIGKGIKPLKKTIVFLADSPRTVSADMLLAQVIRLM